MRNCVMPKGSLWLHVSRTEVALVGAALTPEGARGGSAAALDSKAPISMPAPVGRVTPAMSVGGAKLELPLSIAGPAGARWYTLCAASEKSAAAVEVNDCASPPVAVFHPEK